MRYRSGLILVVEEGRGVPDISHIFAFDSEYVVIDFDTDIAVFVVEPVLGLCLQLVWLVRVDQGLPHLVNIFWEIFKYF